MSIIEYFKQRIEDKQAELALAAMVLGWLLHFAPAPCHQIINTIASAFGITVPETFQDFLKDLGTFLGAYGTALRLTQK